MIDLPLSMLAKGLNVLDAFVDAGLVSSRGDARRIIVQGGAFVNNRQMEDPLRRLTEADLVGGSLILLRLGRNRRAIARFL